MPGFAPRWARSATPSITPWPRTCFSTLKVELVYRTSFRTREEADLELFRYIDGWYNPARIQRALGWRSPDEYEAAYWATIASQPASSTIQADPPGDR